MDKVKLSQIRAQFPMYADVPDHALLGAVHKKFYSDIPRANFLQAIDYDTQRQDPTEGMGGLQTTLAGIGKGLADVGRGLGQFVGAVDRNDVAESRQRDAALMKTTGGKVGNVVGNIAAMLPAAFIPGANTYAGAGAIGALSGLAAPSVSTDETLKNAALGGALGPAALGAGRAIGAGARGLQGLVEPFTKGGQERIAAATLQQFATDPAKAAATLRGAREFVPGSAPTMAQAADDAGIAQLERTLMNNPETGGKLAEQYAAQRAARLGAIQGLAGDPAKRAAAVEARAAAAQPLYKEATDANYLMDPAIEALLKTPVGKQAMARAQTVAANEGRPFSFMAQQQGAKYQPPVPYPTTIKGIQAEEQKRLAMESSRGAFSGVGGLKDDPVKHVTGQGLQDLKMALDDMLSNPMSGIAKSEADAVKNIRGRVVNWMEGQNDAFKTARTTFAEKSTPINTMDVASALMDKLQPALARYGANTREQAAAYANALKAAEETVKKSTGIDKPMSELIDKKATELLENIAKDLGRKAKAEDMGRAVGSNTAQNLAAQNLLRRTLGPAGLPQSWSENSMLHAFLSPYTGVAKLAGSEQRVMDRLLQASLDPTDAAGLLGMAAKPSRAGLLGRQIEPALPALAAGGLLSYRSQ
jgi:hypothetical protein